MRYAIGIFTRHDKGLYACHEVANSKYEAVLSALKSLELYHGQPIDSLEDYLEEMKVEVDVDVISMNSDTDGCVLALHDENNKLSVNYYPNQTIYDSILRMLGGLVPLKQVDSLSDLIKFIDKLDVLVDCKEVKCYD